MKGKAALKYRRLLQLHRNKIHLVDGFFVTLSLRFRSRNSEGLLVDSPVSMPLDWVIMLARSLLHQSFEYFWFALVLCGEIWNLHAVEFAFGSRDFVWDACTEIAWAQLALHQLSKISATASFLDISPQNQSGASTSSPLSFSPWSCSWKCHTVCCLHSLMSFRSKRPFLPWCLD